MRICQRDGCGKQLSKNAKKIQKYCGNQNDKDSCSYEMLKKKMAEYRKLNRAKTCIDCGNQFSSKSWNKVRCGSSRVRGTCAYIHKIKLITKLQQVNKKPKLKIVEKPVPKKFDPDIYITPRLAHLALIKKHNNFVDNRK